MVEEEPSGSNHENGNNQNIDFHVVTDNILIVIEGSKVDDIFEYPPLDFDSGVLTRARIRARNEVLNVHQELCMFNVFISKLEPKTVKVELEHSDQVFKMQSELAEFE